MEQNIGTEQLILGAILCDNTAFEDVTLTADDFYGARERATFMAMQSIYSSGETVDVYSLMNELTKRKQIDDVGGLEFLFSLQTKSVTTANIKTHNKIIKEASIRRKLKRIFQELEAKVEDYEEVDDLVDEAQRRVIELGEDTLSANASTAEEAALRYAEIAKERKKTGEYGINTGYIDLDNMTSGFKRGALVVIAARPSMGKTAFAMNIAQSVAKRGVSLFFSLEMREDELMARVFNSEAYLIGIENIDSRPDYDKTMDLLAKRVARMHLNIYDNAKVTLADIRRVARQVKRREGKLDLIVIDYLQLMTTEKRSDSRVQEVSELTRSLKIMARELDVPIVILSQLNRGVESRTDKHPMMSDLRESGSIEQDADIVLMLYREGFYNPECETPNVTELLINKNRGGAVGKVFLFFLNQHTTFRSMSKLEPPKGFKPREIAQRNDDDDDDD